MPGDKERLHHLDGLRGVAVICVVLFHASILVPSLAGKLLPGGFLGVDLFFVLSGFLMTTILGQDGTNREFYARRAVRILPALYLFLASQVLYTWLIGDPLKGDMRAAIPMALGIGNWNQSRGIPVPWTLAQTWSLGIEEQFYVVWPIIMIIATRRRVDLRRYVVAGIVTVVLTRAVLAHTGVSLGALYSQTECRFDSLLVGALVALLWRDGWYPLHLRKVAVAAVGFLVWALAFARPDSMWLYDGGFTAVALACGVVVLGCLRAMPGTGVLTSPALRSCGRFSYSAYLWHLFIFFAVLRAFPNNESLRVCLATVLLVAVVVVSTRFIEEPLRRYVAGWLKSSRSRSTRQLSTTVASG